jgi:miniconductance mechanosensitive channel
MHKLFEKIFNSFYPLFKKWGYGDSLASYLSLLLNIVILCVLTYGLFIVFRYIVYNVIVYFNEKLKSKLIHLLVENAKGEYLFYLIPLLFIYQLIPIILDRFEYWELVFQKIVRISIIILVVMLIRTFLNITKYYIKQKPKYSDKPIDSYFQIINIGLWIFACIIMISIVFGINPKDFLTVLGAISAVILLIFRDTLLGFVASVQVSINDMIRIGDWITMSKFGVDGNVIEINLATVKVRNFDNTTTTIPTYSLISDSFQNWRGMDDSGGRQIKRNILIKASSIRFLEEVELEDFKKIHLISDYIDSRKIEIDKFNSNNKIDKSIVMNGRNMTNLGLFRKYITEFLRNHPGLNKDMDIICHQLQSSTYGVPLEIYAFSIDKRFENYEYITSDIFDHIFASIAYFDLEIAETPSKVYKETPITTPVNGLL